MDKTLEKNNLDNFYITANLNKKYVLGEGNINSKIIFIGEAPGSEEEASGHPFVGKAGKNLSNFLTSANIDRADIYITNAVKFRPTKENSKSGRLSNRTPSTNEITDYRDWLLKELAIIQPSLVVTLGNTPLFSLTDDKSLKITAIHGNIQSYSNKKYNLEFMLMPFFHPAAIIYRRELIEEYEKDMKKFIISAKSVL